jgi:hypothetical protein
MSNLGTFQERILKVELLIPRGKQSSWHFSGWEMEHGH